MEKRVVARLMTKYNTEIISELKKRLNCPNTNALPRLDKIVVSMGVGKALENKKRLENAFRDMMMICGQRPMITKARKSVAGFKVREGQEVGCKVTLRKARMYEFLDRLITLAIPRVRDFRGLNANSFDKAGNYSLGIVDQTVFPEINLDEMEFPQGMNVTFIISNSNKEKSYELLKQLGMPFESPQGEK